MVMEKTHSTSLTLSFGNLDMEHSEISREGEKILAGGKARGILLLLMNFNSFSIHTLEEEIHLYGLRGPGRDREAGVGLCDRLISVNTERAATSNIYTRTMVAYTPRTRSQSDYCLSCVAVEAA